jgi:hypothetical protein
MAETKRRTPAIPNRLDATTPQPTRGRVGFSSGITPTSTTIPYRIGRTVLAATLAFVVPQFFHFPYFQAPAAANPVIPMRVRSLSELQHPTPIVPPQYYKLVPHIPTPASPVIPISVRKLSELDVIPLPILSKYSRLVPFKQAPASPVIPIRTRPLSELDTIPRPVPSQYSAVIPYKESPPAPVIQIRYGQPQAEAPRALVLSRVFQFPYFQQVVASAQVIPVRTASMVFPAWHAVAYSRHHSYASVEQPATPVIPIRTRPLSELTVVPPIVQPAYGKLIPFSSAQSSAPVIPFRIGTIPIDTPPAIVPARFHRFPYFEQPATPIPGFRYGRPTLADPVALVAPRVFQFPYFQQVVASANPVIPFRKGQWIGEAVQPLVGIHGFMASPFVSTAAAPANPVIPILTRQLSELTVEAKLIPPQVSRRISFIAPPAPVIAIRTRRLVELDDVPRPIPPRYIAFFIPPLPANPVIPYRRGQWLSDAVAPLVGIQGYQEFPWGMPTPVGEPYRTFACEPAIGTFEASDRTIIFVSPAIGTFEASDRTIIFVSKDRVFIVELEK